MNQLKKKGFASVLNKTVLSYLHSYGWPPLSPITSFILSSSFTQNNAVLRQRDWLPQAAPNPAIPLPGWPRWPLQQTVSWAAVFGPHPNSRAPSVGHQLPRTPDPIQALCRVTVLPRTSRPRGDVVAASGGTTRGPIRAAQVHGVAVLFGAPGAWACGQLSAALEVSILGGLGAALGSHWEWRLGHARWEWGRSTFAIRKDWSVRRAGERKREA